MSATTQWENIYHGLDSTPGKLRMSQGGLGWKPSVGEGSTITIPADQMASFQWVRVARNYNFLSTSSKTAIPPSPAQTNPRRTNFDVFVRDDFERLSSHIRQYFNKALETKEVSTRAELGARSKQRSAITMCILGAGQAGIRVALVASRQIVTLPRQRSRWSF